MTPPPNTYVNIYPRFIRFSPSLIGEKMIIDTLELKSVLKNTKATGNQTYFCKCPGHSF